MGKNKQVLFSYFNLFSDWIHFRLFSLVLSRFFNSLNRAMVLSILCSALTKCFVILNTVAEKWPVFFSEYLSLFLSEFWPSYKIQWLLRRREIIIFRRIVILLEHLMYILSKLVIYYEVQLKISGNLDRLISFYHFNTFGPFSLRPPIHALLFIRSQIW